MAGIEAVVDRTDVAEGLQKDLRGWLVMWSKWRQTFTAFSRVTADPVIIDDADFHRLLDRIRQVEQVRRNGPAGVRAG